MTATIWLVLLSLWLSPFVQATLPELHIVGATTDKVLTLDTATADFEATVILEETAGQPITDLKITLGALHGTAPGQIALDWSVNGSARPVSVTLASLDMLELHLSAHLPDIDQYHGTLSVRYADKRETYTLVIDRRAPAAGLALSALPVGPIELDPLSNRGVPVQLTLADAAGRTRLIYAPVLTEVAQLNADNTVLSQAHVGAVKVLNADGGAVSDTLTLPAYQAHAFTINLSQPPGPGRYRATIEVRSPDGPAIQAQVTLLLRHPWWLALLFILAGTFGSYGLRNWFNANRARVVSAMQVTTILEEIDAQAEFSADPLVVPLRARLDRARRDQSAGFTVDIDPLVQDARKRWPFIQDLRGLEQAMKALSPDLVTPVKDQLTAASAALASPGADSLTKAETALNTARTRLDEAWQAARLKPIEDFIATLKTYIADAAWDAVKADLARAQSEAEVALTQAKAGEADKSAATYTNARRLYLGALIAHLRTRLPDATPTGVPDADWPDLRRDLTTRLNGLLPLLNATPPQLTEVEAGYQQALQALMQRLISFLNAEISEWQKTVDDSTRTSPEKLAQARTALQSARQAAKVAEEQLQADKPNEALRAYDQARRELQTLTNALKTPGGPMEGKARAESLTLTPLAGVSQLVAAAPTPAVTAAPQLPSAADLRGQLSRGDLLATCLVGVVASLVGLQLLWVSNSTFGSLGDYIGTLTWGFGLHQLNDATRQAGGPSVWTTLRNQQ